MFLACVVIIVFLAIIHHGFRPLRDRKKYPPGPTPLPFIGNLLIFHGSKCSNFEDALRLQRNFGDSTAVTVWIGATPVVYINTFSGVRDALIDNPTDFASRMEFGMFFDVFFEGAEDIVFAPFGDKWATNKKTGYRLLRKVIESGKLERNVVGATQRMIEDLKKLDLCEPVDVSQYTSKVVCNILLSLCFGTFLEVDDQEYLELLYLRDKNSNPHPILLLLPFLPLKRLWQPLLRRSTFFRRNIVDLADRQLQFYRTYINDHKANFAAKKTAGEETEDLVYAMLDEQRMVNGEAVIDMSTTEAMLFDIFGAGTETTSVTLQWFTIEMAANSALQAELHTEVVNVVGHGAPTLGNRQQLPLVEATIMEVLRLHTPAPLAIPHAPSKPGVKLFGKYEVASDALIMYNIYAVQRDPQMFADPEKFNPYRFMDDGKCIKPPGFIPFGVGKRICMGEQLAKNDLFLVITTLLQRVKFSPVPGVRLELRHDLGTGISNMPKPQKLMIQLR